MGTVRGEASIISKAEADLSVLEQDRQLDRKSDYVHRSQALDRIDFIAKIARLQDNEALIVRAEDLRRRLETVNLRFYRNLRADIRNGNRFLEPLRDLMDPLTAYRPTSVEHRHRSYESIDEFLAGLLLNTQPPEGSIEREPEMVYYEPVPASVVLELVDRVPLHPDQLLYDLGSGLGQVAILYHLLTGVPTRGIEIDPGYVDYAHHIVHDLHLTDVSFVAQDARRAPLGGGAAYFLFTPFWGTILDEVMGRLYAEARDRQIVVAAFGPCVPRIAQQRWLQSRTDLRDHDFRLAVFDST